MFASFPKLALTLALGFAVLSSCRDDEFTSTIFDTTTPAVDTSLVTAPFDQWLYDNYVVPYNVEVRYRFNLLESNMNYQLTPSAYEQSQVLARLLHYLFYQPYEEKVGREFMRQNSPRQFHFIGSNGVNASTGTQMLGYASGGIKITLMCVNFLNTNYGHWTPADMLVANEYYFHTMHHEFSHILHQRKTLPSTFKQITPDTYEPLKWQERDSVTTHQLGYLTHYGSSAVAEDFVETLSCTITDDDDTWMTRIINATLPGLHNGEKEQVSALIDSLEIRDLNGADKSWNNFVIYRAESTDGEFKNYATNRHITILKRDYADQSGYYELKSLNDTTYQFVNDMETDTTIYRRVAVVNPTNGQYKGFNDYLKNWVKVTGDADLTGMTSILRKLDMATEWYTDKWGLYLFAMRHSVQARQDRINEYMTDSVAPFIYHLQ